ncbi:WxL domain-containing protein [Candidatus Enterococcus murrayae]|uniref:WxL domain-containing protein n=2 Tax=Enterococcus TaxID=1350 RepID=A0ABS3HCL9_9ENTE|nr:WxL domain-containing protein [Enterococcus sp. MJM16]MBO0451180.1 WxL domain-containing protein [Enterococcus sp. MJM16]
MNINKIGKTTALLLLLGSLTAPVSLVQAKTYEDVPTAESSILSRTADPIQVSQERLKQVETEDSEEKTEETTEESTKETETTESSEEKEKESSDDETKESSTDSSTETTDSSEEKEKKKQSRATFLREGTYGLNDPSTYDIDKSLSTLLRYGSTSNHTNIDFTGRGKAAGALTDEDMKSLKTFTNNTGSLVRALDVKGLEYAINLENLELRSFTASMNVNVTFGANGKLDLSKNTKIKNIFLMTTELKEIDLLQNTEVILLSIWDAPDLAEVDTSKLAKLERCDLLRLPSLTKVDVTNSPLLNTLRIISAPIKTIDLTSNPLLGQAGLTIQKTKISEVPDLRNSPSVNGKLDSNYISDIRSLMFLDENKRTGLSVFGQQIQVPIPYIDENKNATLDLLHTTNQRGLSVSNINITGSPVLTPNGDKIELSNVTRASLNGKSLSFLYDSNELAEKSGFNGTITFYVASSLKNELTASKKKFTSGDTLDWTWDIKSVSEETAKNVYPTLNLPAGLSFVAGSVEIDGTPVSDSAIDGSTSLGDLAENQGKTITFKTKGIGSVEEWFEAKGKLNWEDTSKESPFESESKYGVQIEDEEQTYTPKPSEEMGILSVPVRFDYGIKDMSNTTQSFGLSPDLYQTNTNVVTNGFYTRVKDDRSTSTGWSLTAQLSSFVDVNDNSRGMPDSHGTALRLEDMSIEAIKDRDTPDEAVDPAPASPQPGTVKSSETIVAGQSAKTLVSAQPYTGQGRHMTIPIWLGVFIAIAVVSLVCFLLFFIKDSRLRLVVEAKSTVLLADCGLLFIAIVAIVCAILLYLNWQEQLNYFK